MRAHLFRRQIMKHVRSDRARVAVWPSIKDNARNRSKRAKLVAHAHGVVAAKGDAELAPQVSSSKW